MKAKQTKRQKLHANKNESISAFKEELSALEFEPIYGDSIKDIIARLTTKIQELAEDYGYQIEFPKKAEIEVDGNIYYFNYNLKIKTKFNIKRLKVNVQYIMFDNNEWIGLITEIK
ncbi:hypothetical protein [Acidianus manzaensis]|uniref:Uncharacterized protein n=1 Tax=Acidianus manzaensis TaxID=282676 RepID=A0A1W6JXM0_9CREN|nr:hypothetical protein [Acidianus manzaensis]ARM74982.1 hypothetical protein B6F84_02345 [Acidianus manzaensis]